MMATTDTSERILIKTMLAPANAATQNTPAISSLRGPSVAMATALYLIYSRVMITHARNGSQAPKKRSHKAALNTAKGPADRKRTA